MPRGNRTSEADLVGRLDFAAARLSCGDSYASVVRACRQRFGVSESTAKNYVRRSGERLREATELRREIEISRTLARLEDIYERAMENEDWKAALGSVRALCTLLGLYENPRRVERRVITVSAPLQLICAGEDSAEDIGAVADSRKRATNCNNYAVETVSTSLAA